MEAKLFAIPAENLETEEELLDLDQGENTPLTIHLIDQDLIARQLLDQHLAGQQDMPESCQCQRQANEPALLVGRNCRLDEDGREEILQLNEELEDLRHWFQEYGRNGILFPESIINAFQEICCHYLQAA
jgi:hypothetical protein